MFGRRRSPRNCNFVHNDEIWKAHVERERETTKKWPELWGFMLPEKVKKRGHKGKGGMPHYSIANSTLRTVKVKGVNGVKLPPISVKPHPKTTSGLIGWRNTTLERYGRHARGITKVEVPVSILFRM